LAGDEALRAEAYAILAMNRLRTRRIDAAETDIAATVAILDRIGANEELRARAHMVRAGIASVRMDFALADRELDRAVELWGHNDEALAITALYNRAINQHYRARMQPSAAAFERTLEGFERARDAQSGLYGPDHASVGRSWHSIGLVLLSLDRHEQALDAFERAFASAQRTGGNIEQTVAMLGQAEALRGLKRWEEGIAAYEECLRLSALERQSCNYGKGVCLAALERLPEASQALRAAYELSVTDDVSVPRTRAISAFDLAQVLARQGQLGQARELAEEALRRAQGDEQAREILAEVRSWLADNPRVANAR
jgi:tetratricopeptide (TPR) repeat protein